MDNEKKVVEEIINTMKEVNAIGKNFEIIDPLDLSIIYQNCIDKCPKGEGRILKSLKFDLFRITEYKHHLPDLLSNITWENIFSEYNKRGENELQE